jgi:hypothetical protein
MWNRERNPILPWGGELGASWLWRGEITHSKKPCLKIAVFQKCAFLHSFITYTQIIIEKKK